MSQNMSQCTGETLSEWLGIARPEARRAVVCRRVCSVLLRCALAQDDVYR